MRNTFELSQRSMSQLQDLTAAQTNNFSELVRIVGLSRTIDFRGADLSGVDFSHSDLRGFDFSGADLSGTYGRSFQIDETTILESAIVTNSVLAFEKSRRDYFADFPEHAKLFHRLRTEYWTTGAVWVGDNLKQSSKNFGTSAKIAKYLYATVKDQTYKNQILYGIRNTFESNEEYKRFLLDQLMDPTASHRTLRGVIDILARLFSSDDYVKRIILLFLDHKEYEIRKISVRPVMEAKFYRENREAIIECMQSEPALEVRRVYTECFTKTNCRDASILFDETHRFFIDYAEPIDTRTFERLLRSLARRQKVLTRTFHPSNGSHENSVTYLNLEELGPFAESFDLELKRFVELGLPLTLNYSTKDFQMKMVKRLLDEMNGSPSG